MMTKEPILLRVDDVTIFTRALAKQLGDVSPSHLKLMNVVARAAGFQNFQHMRASSAAAERLIGQQRENVVDARVVERTLRQFDVLGRLCRWPSRRSVQTLALWGLWSTLPSVQTLSEQAVNEHFSDEHLFEDPAILRRTMISCSLITRRNDGTNYRRVEQEPPAEAKAVIRVLSARRRERGGKTS